jgi:hypothetical protein
VRLDHLLSKEHAPSFCRRVSGGHGGVRIVESSTNAGPSGPCLVSTTWPLAVCGGWVWNVGCGWVVGFQARCWGSEASEPGSGVIPGRRGCWSWLFDFWIVDASIARTDMSPAGAPFWGVAGGGGCPVWVFVFVVCVFVVFVECLCLASCKGHMVDALASRADEGRWSLR